MIWLTVLNTVRYVNMISVTGSSGSEMLGALSQSATADTATSAVRGENNLTSSAVSWRISDAVNAPRRPAYSYDVTLPPWSPMDTISCNLAPCRGG